MSQDDETPDDAKRPASRPASPTGNAAGGTAGGTPKPRKAQPAKRPQPAKTPSKAAQRAAAASAAKPASKKTRDRPKAAPSKAGAATPKAQIQAPPEPELQSVAEPLAHSPVEAPPQSPVEGPPERPTGWRLLLTVGRPRASRGQFVVALLCGLLGFALVTQVHSESNVGLSSARQADLVDVLDSLSAKSDQLHSQIADEQETLSKLTGGTDQTQAALQEAQERATTLRILAGTVGASGPGIDLHIDDPSHKVTADVLLDTLEELRDAGAEAIAIRGAQSRTTTTDAASNSAAPISGGPTASSSPGGPLAVRLVASSYFVDPDDGQGVIADGTLLLPPYDLLAIGDPPTLDQAMGIPGGVLDTLKGRSASGTVTELDTVRITALHALAPPKYARPAASPPS